MTPIERTKREPLRISENGHYFIDHEGKPFFYLADTAWMLFCKLTESECREYFEDRAGKGFTAIQVVIFRDLFEPNTPNVAGIRPFASDADMNAVRLNDEWIDWVVHITRIAAEYDLVMALLPTWGDKWNEHSNSAGPVIMDEQSAKRYCRQLSDALAGCENVIWVLGGDSPVQRLEYARVIRGMAAGIREGGSGDRLMTFHPSGMGSSAVFHADAWLDFNSLQTSHYKPNIPGYLYVERLFHEEPAKPCLDMEPNYELSLMFAIGRRPEGLPYSPMFSAYDVRKSLYRTVLAGAAGFTYGCEPIRQFIRPGDRVHIWRDAGLPDWHAALSAPGSDQLALLPRILSERSYLTRVPAQELIVPHRERAPWPDRMAVGIPFAGQENLDPVAHISVARSTDGSWIMAYMPVRQLLEIDTSGMTGERIRVSLYDPELAEPRHVFETAKESTIRLMPDRDLDSFIVLDSL